MSDLDLDLEISRRLSARPDRVWRALTEPDLLMRWFAPRPWSTPEAAIELRPGGRFFTRMQGPTGESHAGEGCVLAVEPERRLVWTDALAAGWRPNAQPFMTAEITLAADGDGTLYRALVKHKDGGDRERHLSMGFHEGWAICAAQLDEVSTALGAPETA